MSQLSNKFSYFLEEKLIPAAGRFATLRHIQALRDGLSLAMPFMIIGSLFLLLSSLPVPGYNELMSSLFGEGWAERMTYPVGATFDLMAIFGCIGLSYRLAESYKLDPLACAATALAAFMLVTPYEITTATESVRGIPLNFTNSRGLFVAMIVGILSVEIYRWVVEKGIAIRMPEGVPPAVSRSFSSLLPALFVITILWLLRMLLEFTSFEHIHNVVDQLLSTPLKSVAGTYLGMIAMLILINLLWVCGLHGPAIVMAVTEPVFLMLNDMNRLAFQAGDPLPNSITQSFLNIFVSLGGSGSTLTLTFMLAFLARSKQLKQLGRMSVVPGIFNINEPIIFGLPVIFNPVMIIPFILAPVAVASIGYWAMELELVTRLSGVFIPWTIPVGISGFLASGGSLLFALVQLLALCVSGLIYYPFFKAYDRQKCKEERSMEQEVSSAQSPQEAMA